MTPSNIHAEQEIPILFCSNREYCQHMAAAIVSLLMNSPGHRFRIVAVLTDEAVEERKRVREVVQRFPNAAIEFIDYDRERIRDFRVDNHITLDTYVRLFLPDFLDASIKKLIYLDCDLVVCSDISELMQRDMAGHIVAAVQDAFSDQHTSLGFAEQEAYFNAGVLLIDVQGWRDMNLTDALVSYIRENKAILRYHDQDAINGVLRGKITPLPLKWNFTPRHADTEPEVLGLSRAEFNEVRRHPGIVHFASGFMPWNRESEHHYKGWYFRYRTETPWGGEESSSAGGRSAFVPAIRRRAMSMLKWYCPAGAGLLRRWMRLGDPLLQSKFLTRRSLSG